MADTAEGQEALAYYDATLALATGATLEFFEVATKVDSRESFATAFLAASTVAVVEDDDLEREGIEIIAACNVIRRQLGKECTM